MLFNHDLYKKDVNEIAAYNLDWKQFEDKSIVITGATGMICSFLIDVLMFRNERYHNRITIYAISRNSDYAKNCFASYWENPFFVYIKQDISEKFTWDISADYIIHGASNSYPASFTQNPVGIMKSNLWGLSNLMDYYIKNNSRRILYISSGEVYGEGTGNDFNESFSGYIDCLNPRACYPSSKRAAETLCVSYAQQYNIDVVIARPCHIYGPTLTKADNRAFAQFMRNILSKENIVMKSAGKQYRSYCYVADCVSALLVILLNGQKNNAYNISNKYSSVSIADLAKIIAEIGQQKVIFEHPSGDEGKEYSGISRAILSSTKLESLGWKPLYALADGIQRTFRILLNE
jgi:nucleoside-diphosphate-sugar epimerase